MKATEQVMRGKTSEGKWVTGYYVHFEDFLRKREAHRITSGEADSTPEADGYDFCASWDDVDPATLGRFTGQVDKNGREIYEGDILRGDCYSYHDEGTDNYFGVIFFSDEDFDWEVMRFLTAKSERRGISNFTNVAFYDTDFSKMEVIGNIWDNKGLFRYSDEEILEWFNEE